MDSSNGRQKANTECEESESRENGDDRRPKKLKPSSFPISDSDLRGEFSHHQPGVARINNGSFGSCPASVMAAQSRWQRLFLQQPDDFYFNRLQPSILCSRRIIKDLINADHLSEVSIVDNATTAAAIVLQQIAWAFTEGKFRRGDAVVMLHYAYGAVKKSIQAYVSRAGAHVIEVDLPFPVHSDHQVILEFRRALEEGKANGRRVCLSVIDHITSMPTVLIPVKELVRICRDEGVDQVFVDAAHAMGTIPIDVKEIGADFYTSNLHKWFFCPPSAALLYCKKSSNLSDLHHPVVSHEYGNGLAVESAWIGTRDYSSQLVLPSVMEFLDRFDGGIGGIMKRNHEAVVKMGEMLAQAWGTHLGTPPHMCSSMIMVGLPPSLRVRSETEATELRTLLRERFDIEVPIYVKPPKHEEDGSDIPGDTVTGYARISHQVYNTVDDYNKFRDAINKLVGDGFNCEMLSGD